MPRYDYECQECLHKFEITCKISEKDDWDKSCPECKSTNTLQKIYAAPATCDAVSMGKEKNQKGFKEMLRTIHQRTPGSVMDKTTDLG